MDKYLYFTSEELAADAFFRKWVLNPDVNTIAFWTSFLKQHPDKQADVVQAKALLNALASIHVRPTRLQQDRVWDRIDQYTRLDEADEDEANSRARRYIYGRPLAMAAVVLLLVGLGWWFTMPSSKRSEEVAQLPVDRIQATNWIHQENKRKTSLKVSLPDGSYVVLQPKSWLHYPEKFTDAKREVQLEGEGFFEVSKNPNHPFMVFAKGLVTQVVGTSFTIKAYENKAQVSVSVRTGKVAVYTLKELQESVSQHVKIAHVMLLTPNQQAILDTESEQLTKRLVDEPQLISGPAKSHSFVFENASAPNVFKKLEEAYGVSIEYNEEAFEQCNLTAPLGSESLYKKLDIICLTMGAMYEVKGAKIIIKGQGCRPTL